MSKGKKDNPFMETGEEKRGAPSFRVSWRLYFLVVFVGVIMVGAVFISLIAGNRIAAIYAPLVDASMEIKLEAALALNVYKDVMLGVPGAEFQKAMVHVEQSMWYAQAMLEGGKNKEGVFLRVPDPQLIEPLTGVLEKQQVFCGMMRNRFINLVETSAANDVPGNDQQLYDVYNDFTLVADAVETQLQQSLARELKRFRLIQKALMFTLALLALFLVAVNHRFIRSRINDHLTLQESERRLRMSEGQLKSILGTVPVGIGVVRDRVIQQVNQRFCEILGYYPEELLGKSSRNIYPSEEEFLYVGKEKYTQILEHGSGSVETRLLHKDGRIMDVLISSSPIEADDRSGAVIFTVLDITKRKQAEVETTHLRNLLKNITDSMPSVLVAVDITGEVTHWNREAELICDGPPEKLQGLSLSRAFPQLANGLEMVRKAVGTGRIQKQEVISLQLKRKSRFVSITVYPLIINDIVDGAVLRVDDVTEQVRLQEVVSQSEKMRSVGGLAAGMAHEINNPLAGIMQNIQVVENRLKSSLRKNRQIAEACGISIEAVEEYVRKRKIFKMIDSVMIAGRRAREIVGNMVSFSRTSESKFAPHQLSELMDKTIELASNDYELKKKYDFRNVTIQRQYQGKIPDVQCEGTRIQQVFLSLLRNGAQAMVEIPGDQTAEPYKPRFIIRISAENEMARIEIEDNGPGLEESVRKRIFEPFFTTRETGDGTGLGLSIAYFIVTHSHAGKMWVESIRGNGTKFVIHLPYSPALRRNED